jgi:hypothetical protein
MKKEATSKHKRLKTKTFDEKRGKLKTGLKTKTSDEKEATPKCKGLKTKTSDEKRGNPKLKMTHQTEK